MDKTLSQALVVGLCLLSTEASYAYNEPRRLQGGFSLLESVNTFVLARPLPALRDILFTPEPMSSRCSEEVSPPRFLELGAGDEGFNENECPPR